MSRQHAFKSVPSSSKQADRRADVQHRQIESPYLTSREAIAYLKLPSLSALYSHIRENQLPVLRCGGELRFDARDLDAWLRGTSAIELVRRKKA